MIIDGGQFGSFDGLDNRRAVMELFVRMGDGLDEYSAARRRATFLQSLIRGSTSGFSRTPGFSVSPCSAVDAYLLFVAITGCLDVPVERAAKLLEAEVRRR